MVDVAQQGRRIDHDVEVRGPTGAYVGHPNADQIIVDSETWVIPCISGWEYRELAVDTTREISAEIRGAFHDAGCTMDEHGLDGPRRVVLHERVRSIHVPRECDPEFGCDGRKNVDGLDVRGCDASVTLAGTLDEQRHRCDVRESGPVRRPERESRPQAHSVVRGHDDESVVVHSLVAQAFQQPAEESIDGLRLQQVPLVVEGDGPGIGSPAPAPRAPENAWFQAEPLSRRQIDPRLVRQQHVQEVQRGSGVAGVGSDLPDEVDHGLAPVLRTPHPPPVAESPFGGPEVPPALRHGGQPGGGDGLRQHRPQVYDCQIAQHREEPIAHFRPVPFAQRLGTQAGQRLVDVELIARPKEGEEIQRMVVGHRTPVG